MSLALRVRAELAETAEMAVSRWAPGAPAVLGAIPLANTVTAAIKAPLGRAPDGGMTVRARVVAPHPIPCCQTTRRPGGTPFGSRQSQPVSVPG